MKTITVSVTQEDIDRGKPTLPHSCPISLALQRRFADPLVWWDSWTPDSSFIHSMPLSRRAARFVHAFDHHKPVTPATFRLVVPE